MSGFKKQIEPVEESDIADYQDDLYDTWIDLWESGKFPDIVNYLEKWRDRFYLFDKNSHFKLERGYCRQN